MIPAGLILTIGAALALLVIVVRSRFRANPPRWARLPLGFLAYHAFLATDRLYWRLLPWAGAYANAERSPARRALPEVSGGR